MYVVAGVGSETEGMVVFFLFICIFREVSQVHNALSVLYNSVVPIVKYMSTLNRYDMPGRTF